MELNPVQDAIESAAATIITAYPLAAGLVSVSDVINQLPPPRPLPASLFSTSASSFISPSGTIPEPLFAQYEREIRLLLAGATEGESAELTQWREGELRRVQEAMRDELAVFHARGDTFGSVRYPAALASFPENYDPSCSTSTLNPDASSQLLDQIRFPYPAHHQLRSITPPALPPAVSDSSSFFAAFLDEQKSINDAKDLELLERVSASTPMAKRGSRGATKKAAAAAIAKSNLPAASSPDPLGIGIDAATSRNRTTSSSSSSLSLAKKRPSTQDLQAAQQGPERSVTPTTPEAVMKSPTGVESAVKRIKLGSGASNLTSGKGTQRENTDIVEKISDLTSDLFSIDDSYIVDTSSSSIMPKSPGSTSTHFFRSTATTTDNLPLMKAEMLKKFLKQLNLVRSKGKAKEFFEEVEEGGVGRLLKTFERSWRGVDELRYWSEEALRMKPEPSVNANGKAKGKVTAAGEKKSSPVVKRKKKTSKGGDEEEMQEEEDDEGEEYIPGASTSRLAVKTSSRGRSRSRTPAIVNTAAIEPEDVEMNNEEEEEVWNQTTLLDFALSLRSLTDALIAIRVALTLLTLIRLPKHLYSADFVASILTSLRHTLDAFLFPLLEAAPISYLDDLAQSQSTGISTICEELEAIMPLVARLVRQEETNEEIVTSMIYCSLSPFFHEATTASAGFGTTTTGKGKKVERATTVERAMKGIRMASLGLIKSVYAKYEDQRAWIIEEVLSNLTQLEVSKKGKGGLRLRNGTSIHTVSALIFHLVQTCSSTLRLQLRSRIATDGDESMLVEVDLDAEAGEEDGEANDVVSNLTRASKDLIEPALDSAMKSARTIITYLLQKSCKSTKAVVNSLEAEYRAVFDNLINDLLATLHLPEWPASELMLTVCCRSMMTALADTKTTAEVTAIKGVALEHLGTIGARVRADFPDESKGFKSLHEIVATSDTKALEGMVASQEAVLSHLSRSEKAENTAEGAAEFTAALFARDLTNALTSSNALVGGSTFSSRQGQLAKDFNDRMKVVACEYMEGKPDDDVFGPSIEDEQPRIDQLALQLAQSQPLAGLYEPLLARILESSESTAVAFRAKALRAISLIVAQDENLFGQANVRKTIENRMLDSSPAVRDAAIELVGKYIVGRRDLAIEYLPKIAERVNDTGVGVRRRVVKLLKSLYSVVDDEALQVEICRKLIWRVFDEDDGIKDLAVEVVEELWFTRSKAKGKNANNETRAIDAEVARIAKVIMNVTGVYTDRPAPVEDVLRLIFSKHAEKGTTPPIEILREVTESLIDGLVENEDSLGFNVVHCIKTIHILTAVDPSLLSTAKATMLLPFLKSATSPEEQVICDYLLKIFRSSVVGMPKTASKFAKDLQTALLPMINKPSGGTTTLQEVVACFCAVVLGQTQDYRQMIVVFKACYSRLSAQVTLMQDSQPPTRALPLLCSLAALFCEHGKFDQIRRDDLPSKELIDSIAPTSITQHVYSTLINLYSLSNVSESLQGIVLASLGFVFRSYPMLMLEQGSTDIMDAIFASGSTPMQAQLLRIIQDFLASQGRSTITPSVGIKVKLEQSDVVKMEELVGNVDGFADSGVASAICQRYIDEILSNSLSLNPVHQRIAVDILSSIARSGFGHPLSVTPTLVALSSAPDPQIAQKAFSMLTLLHQKHASLLATRFMEPAKISYNYAAAVAGSDSVARGYSDQDPPLSVFGKWYNLYRDKRQHKLDYIRTLTRVFEINPGGECSEDDVHFRRYIAEALATLDFKTSEEPMMIIVLLNTVLAVAGLAVLNLLEEDSEGGKGIMSGVSSMNTSPLKSNGEGADGDDEPRRRPKEIPPPKDSVVRQSIICAIALKLRDHLKYLYSISDAKLSKFTIGKKSTQGDRAATRRAEAPLVLDYSELPFALSKLETLDDLLEMRYTYIELLMEDGIGLDDQLDGNE